MKELTDNFMNMFSKLILCTLLAGQTVSAGVIPRAVVTDVTDITVIVTQHTTIASTVVTVTALVSYTAKSYSEPAETTESSVAQIHTSQITAETLFPHATTFSRFPASFDFSGTITASVQTSFSPSSSTTASATEIIVTPLTELTASGHATYVPESGLKGSSTRTTTSSKDPYPYPVKSTVSERPSMTGTHKSEASSRNPYPYPS